jgi:hypothetical protein
VHILRRKFGQHDGSYEPHLAMLLNFFDCHLLDLDGTEVVARRIDDMVQFVLSTIRGKFEKFLDVGLDIRTCEVAGGT